MPSLTHSGCLRVYRSRKDIDAIEVDETELESQIQVHGSYRKPEFKELAIVQFWFLPYYLFKSVSWYARWFYKYNLKNEEYTDEDKAFIVRGILNISERAAPEHSLQVESWHSYFLMCFVARLARPVTSSVCHVLAATCRNLGLHGGSNKR